MAEIAGLNYDSKLAIQDWQYLANIIEQELLERTKLVFGSRSLASPRFGIIDQLDPKAIVATDSNRPLVVSVSQSNALQLDITPGGIINPNGTIVIVPSLIEGFVLPSTNANDVHVVFVRNSIIDTPPSRITRFNTSQKVRRTQDTNVVLADSLTNFQNATLYPATAKADITVIAVVTVVQTTAGLELQLDYTNANYSFNRPWYSPVDVEHRSKLGTGVATDSNPHATAFDDLTAGSLALYDLILKYGRVQSRDEDLKGIPGFFCFESITPSRILTDTGGATTAGSRYGGPGAKYIVLSNYPIHVMSFYITGQQSRAIAYDWIRGTRIIVLPLAEVFAANATIEYNRSTAAELPAAILSNTVVFNQPDVTRENIYTGGRAVNTIVNPNIDFDGSGPFPRGYEIFLNGDGTLVRTPQPIDVTVTLDDIAPGPFPSAIYNISQNIFGPAKIKIGLADANPVPGMTITIRIYGTDVSVLPLQEDVVFSGTSWTPSTGAETESQFVKTLAVFSSVTGIQIMNRLNDGPNAKIRLFAELESGTTLALNKLASLAKIQWDGVAIADARDSRNIVATIPPTPHRYRAVAEMLPLILIFSEDLQDPRFYETAKGTMAATFSSFQLFVDDWSLLLASDQVNLRPGKTLTCITVGTPNRGLGQFLASTDNDTTAADIILTINDPVFNSGILATPVGTNGILATKTTAGSAGNETVSLSLVNATAMTLSGTFNGKSIGGYDAFGEIHLPRHEDFLDSRLPNPFDYDVTDLRYRYMSRAFIVDQKNRVTVQFHGFNDVNDLQLRTRIASATDTQWQPWVIQTMTGPSATFTSPSPIIRVQIEAFGGFAGVSVLEGDI